MFQSRAALGGSETRPHLIQRHGNVLVNSLPLVVVFWIQLAIGSSDCLRSFIGLETQVAKLVFVRQFLIAQAVVTEHQVVVGLQILRIDGQNTLQ